ncbi:50S ribosomal protein L17 [Candidatus Nomurabacteria bacterium]|nr:50S ribosomal protein L17 [Candidatus Nomurabacteria bacterium]
MHRHGYKGRKFGRERDQRTALTRSLAVSLIEHGSIETTLPKAKDLRPTVEKLVSKAKKADLHNRRQIVSALNSVTAAHKLVDQIAPAMKRTSGYLRIERTTLRRGDNSQMARISFVDDINAKPETAAKKPAVKKPTPATPKGAK